jgi:pyroglutamyl-peptidase
MAKSPQEGSSMTKTALVTGFEPYGGHTLNPSAKVALALDGAEIGGLRIVGRVWPVTFAGLLQRLEAALDEAQPAVVIALGLCPGEPMIRLERFGVNLADFEIADNSGEWLKDAPIARDGATARTATLPLRAIERALLDAGIPARLSNTAGTYLCNAALYALLGAVERRGWRIPCGFIHLPYLPEQVAAMLVEAQAGRLAIDQRADIASMDLAVTERAVRLALAVAATPAGGRT